jgi:hypothetical protein
VEFDEFEGMRMQHDARDRDPTRRFLEPCGERDGVRRDD